VAADPVDPERIVNAPAKAPTRDQRRSGRLRAVARRTITLRTITLRDLAIGAALYPERPGVDYLRPAIRGDCIDGPRPCPFVSCRYHLYLDVTHAGGVTLNFPDLEPEEMVESCALDVADRGGVTLEELGEKLNTTRERVRQIEAVAFAKVKPRLPPREDL